MTAGRPPWTRGELLERLTALGLRHTTTDHSPVFRVEESAALMASLPGAHTKNLFLKDGRGRFWLVVAKAGSMVDLKALPKRIGAGRLSFGSAEMLFELLGVTPGSVTPLALINDPDQAVSLILDDALAREAVWNLHPLRNDATTAMSREDVLRFLDSLGRRPIFVNLGPSPDCAPDPARPS